MLDNTATDCRENSNIRDGLKTMMFVLTEIRNKLKNALFNIYYFPISRLFSEKKRSTDYFYQDIQLYIHLVSHVNQKNRFPKLPMCLALPIASYELSDW